MNYYKKNNNGWILCPSKSFPGKFYYFNVNNGEAAWSLTELDKQTLKDIAVPKVTNKSNIYPEPNSPPENNTGISFNTDTSYKLHPNCNKVLDQSSLESQIFGQGFFPKYISNVNPYMPNVMWTPVQLPTPMLVPNVPEVKKPMSDQVTQTQEFEQERLVQASGLSLSERFHIYKNNNTNESCKNSNNNDSENIYTLNNNCNRLLILRNKKSKAAIDGNTLLRETVLKNSLNMKVKNYSDKISLNEKATNLLNETGKPEKFDEINQIKLDESIDTPPKKLDKSDLRLLLVAKKGQKLKMGDSCKRKSLEDENVNKNITNIQSQNVPKKRVTFNLVSQCDEEASDGGDTRNRMKSPTEVIHILKNLGKASMHVSIWFIVADLNVLLNEFEYIESFVRNVQEPEQDLSVSVSVEIMHCCLKLIEDKHHVVLITTDTELYAEGIALNVHCYMLEQIKAGVVNILLQSSFNCDNSRSNNKSLENVPFLEETHNFQPFILKSNERLIESKENITTYNLKNLKVGYSDLKRIVHNEKCDLKNYSELCHDKRVWKIDNNNCEKSLSKNKSLENIHLQKVHNLQPYVLENKERLIELKEDITTRDFQNLKVSYSDIKRIVRNKKCDLNYYSEPSHNERVLKIDLNNPVNSNLEKCNSNTTQLQPYKETNSLNQFVTNSSKESKTQRNANVDYNQVNRLLNVKKTIFNADVSTHNDISGNHKNNACIDIKNKKYVDKNIISSDGSEIYDSLCLRKFNSSTTRKHIREDNNIDDFEDPAISIELSLYEKLKQFQLKSKVIEDRITLRADEWICTFTQIMENFMVDLLRDESVSSINPCTILETADDVAKLFDDHPPIKIAAYGLSALYNLINPNGKLQANINPNDVLKTIGCGKLLVESIKTIRPNSETLKETEELLVYLLHCIENPETDPKHLEFTQTPPNSHIDIEEDICAPKHVFVKEPSEVLIYLKKYVPEWKTYNEKVGIKLGDCTKQIKDLNNSPNIVRTIGRHLNTLKINNYNKITLDFNVNNDNVEESITANEKEDQRESNKIIKAKSKRSQAKNIHEKTFDSLQDFDFPVTHGNTFSSNHKTNCGPKVIRNVGIIKAFEDKLNNKSLEKFDCNSLNKPNSHMIYEDRFGTNKHLKLNDKIHGGKDVLDGISETFTDDTAYETQVNNIFKKSVDIQFLASDASNDDSGLGKENYHAYTFIKTFLVEMSSSLKLVYKFINDSVVEIKGKNIQVENRKAIYDKSEKTYKLLSVITDELKRIIEREPEDGSTIKSLLIKAGVDVTDDKRITRYRQVVTKCLEQVRLLQHGLKVLLSITNENSISMSIISEQDSNICYFNIFE
ncbi:unnamed protein product [Parnassius apollo]|uniref:(apollo) hypothetical protein n=1 Tax=Parnassius apollo TaxID=110799 RepID=A0A8S3WAC8_PARAO|nr:unnamed protein product [Parnassius apollo]